MATNLVAAENGGICSLSRELVEHRLYRIKIVWYFVWS